jgi:hypothetical protein
MGAMLNSAAARVARAKLRIIILRERAMPVDIGDLWRFRDF